MTLRESFRTVEYSSSYGSGLDTVQDDSKQLEDEKADDETRKNGHREFEAAALSIYLLSSTKGLLSFAFDAMGE